MSKQSAGLRAWGPLGALAFPDARHAAVSSASLRVIPWLSREASGSSAPLPYRVSLEELLRIESSGSFEHVRDRTSQLLGQDGQGVTRIMFFLHAGEVFLGCWMVSEEQDGGCSKGPREMGMAERGA